MQEGNSEFSFNYNNRLSNGDGMFLEARNNTFVLFKSCLLYTSDAADERSSVDLGGRRIIKKKKKKKQKKKKKM